MIIELLLTATLACEDGNWILSGLKGTDLSKSIKNEIAETVIESMPKDCPALDYDPPVRDAY